jgi:hypothetical protein
MIVVTTLALAPLARAAADPPSAPAPRPRPPPEPPPACPSPAQVKQLEATAWSLPRKSLMTFHARRDCLEALGRGVPVARDGKPWGLELRNIPPDGFVAALGLRDKDVLVRVAGLPVHSTESALVAYVRVLIALEVEVELSRAGAPHRHRYRLLDD